MIFLLIAILTIVQFDTLSTRLVHFIPAESDGLPNFGVGSSILFNPDGSQIYYADNSFGIIRVFKSDGSELYTIGRKGNGPGEFQNIQSMILSRDGAKLHVLDYRNARIVTYDAKNGEYLTTTVIKFPSYLITTLSEIQDEFILVGSTPHTDAFFHRFNKKGELIGEFGSLLNFSAMTAGLILAKEQLTQGFLVDQGNEIVGISHAPFNLVKFNRNYVEIQSATNPIIPEPWEKHIKVSKDEYYVGFYPRVAFAKLIDKDLIMASLIWPDSKEHIVQLLDFRTLKQVHRRDVDYKLLKDAIKISKNKYWVLFSNPDTLDLEIQEWTVN